MHVDHTFYKIYNSENDSPHLLSSCKRMEHIYQFQLWLVFFISLGMFLSLAPFVNSSDSDVSRKLLDTRDRINRIGQDCSKEDIGVFQGSTSPLPNGVPTYTVEIVNSCLSDCSIAEIHVSCGWFSSVRLVNPSVFRRVSYDDCLVNDGEPLGPGETLSFQYANSFSYPLSVSSVSCF